MLQDLLTEVECINLRISQFLEGEYKDDRRLTLTLAYLNLSLDHHGSIILLMRNERHSSAMALVRVLFEAMIRAYWVVKCASDAQVDKVAEKDSFQFPNMDALTKAVDQACSDPQGTPLTFFQQAQVDAWKPMNSYTHSGLLQLARQFSGSLKIEANYPEGDLISGVNAATGAILLLGHLLATLTGRQTEAEKLEELFSFGESEAE
ncbi:MAG: DUF6988 family protein [Bryobacteraceae bacterium]